MYGLKSVEKSFEMFLSIKTSWSELRECQTLLGDLCILHHTYTKTCCWAMAQASNLFRTAEPLLRQQCNDGWTREDNWQVLCERWLKDAKVEYKADVKHKRAAVRQKMK